MKFFVGVGGFFFFFFLAIAGNPSRKRPTPWLVRLPSKA